MQLKTLVPILVVSSSPYMRGILKFVLETLLMTEVTELDNEEKALNFLKALGGAPAMIVYDYTSDAYLLEDFVGYLNTHQKKVRIVILVDEVREEARELLRHLEQFKLIDEATLPNSLVDEVKSLQSAEFINDNPYCRIDIDFLSILDGINKNLFIRIGNDKYIKIFNEDDTTDILDIKKYKTKGISCLYIKRSTAMWVIHQIQSQISIFLRANNFRFVLRGASDTPVKRFENKILRIDDEVHIDKDFKEIIDRAVEKIRQQVEKETKVENYLKNLKDKQDDYALFTQKVNLTSLVSCLLAKQLEWISKSTMDKLVYTSVLCDITLAVRPHLLSISGIQEFEKIKDSLSEEDQKIYLSHPKDSAFLIKEYFQTAPTDTDSLAYQHHEQPDGNGFPLGLKAEKISPLSALFVISNDFTYYFLKDDEPSVHDFVLKAHSRYDYVNFRKIIKALEKLKK
jgi:hypothetical protein